MMQDNFQYIKPCGLLENYIRYHWSLQSDFETCQLTFPIGCTQLIFHRGTPLYVSTAGSLQNPATVSGQTDYPSYLSSSGNWDMIVTVFEPYAAGSLLGLPCNLLYNREVAAEDLGDSSLTELSRRVIETESIDDCVDLIEKWFLKRIYDSASELNTNRVRTAVMKINRDPFISLPELSEAVNLSHKQFKRVFSDRLGMNPKEFYRVVRFQRAIGMMQHNNSETVSFSDISYACGFSDQSHMIKEFKTFSGLTPLQLLQAGSPYSDYFSSPV